MEFLLVASALFGSAVVLFVLMHISPLNAAEVLELSVKQRRSRIQSFFKYDNREYSVDLDFKKRMASNGRFYPMEEELSRMPSTAAALLKYKKHEWIILAFARERCVELIWVNKGPDGTGVSSFLSDAGIQDRCRAGGYDTVLQFHNHPNSNPQYLDCSKPSPRDIETAHQLAALLNNRGVALVEFVCERGLPYRYFLSPPSTFYPLTVAAERVRERNGVSRIRNLGLHIERIFG